MTDQPRSLQPLGSGFEVSPDAEPVALQDVKNQLGMVSAVIPARDLVGQELTIIAARLTPSELEEQTYYYFVAFKVPKDDRIFGSAFGGGAVCDVISRYIASHPDAPLVATLNWHEGKGRYEGYYTLD